MLETLQEIIVLWKKKGFLERGSLSVLLTLSVAALVCFAVVMTAAIVTAVIVVMCADGVGVVGEFPGKKSRDCVVCIAGDAGVKLDASFRQCGACTAADTAADEGVNTLPDEESCQRAVTAAVRRQDTGLGDGAGFDRINLKGLSMAEVTEDLTVFVRDCKFHGIRLVSDIRYIQCNTVFDICQYKGFVNHT